MESSELSELLGAIIGDGNIWKKKYEIVISGDQYKDREYFIFLSGIIERNFDYSPKIKYRQGALRLKTRSKKFYEHVTKFFPKGKTALTVEIPENVDEQSILRGIFDTDGTIFFSEKPGVKNYPTIEITTISKILASQLYSKLLQFGFRPTLRHRKEIHNTYKIALNGRNQVLKWLDEIGSSNPTKKIKLKIVKSLNGLAENRTPDLLRVKQTS